jgi:hypothetical protein
MAIQMNDDGTVSDAVTKENQKGYSNYEKDLEKRQAEMTSKDANTKEKYMRLMEAGMNMLGRPVKAPEGKAKGGKIKSASARADGCCIRGKTKA